VVPALEATLKTSHLFNLMDARGAISVTERVGLIARVRKHAVQVANAYVAQRETLGHPLGNALEANAREAG
jgi:glycyl-tRNA synthetase alpha chain